MRKDMWKVVAKRLHNPQKIFPFGGDDTEVMIYGGLEYTMKDDKKVDVSQKIDNRPVGIIEAISSHSMTDTRERES